MKHKTKSSVLDPIETLEHYVIDPVVEQAVKDRPKTNLESDNLYRHRMKDQLKESLLKYQKRLLFGVEALSLHKKWPHDDRIKKGMELFSDPAQINTIVESGMTLQDILRFTKEELLSFYSVGLELYNRGAYHESSHIFLLLTQLNPFIAAFWSALGAAEDKSGDTQGALYAYLMAVELEENTLAPSLHAAKCLLLLNHPEEAKKILQLAIEKCEKNDALKNEKQKAEQMLLAIK